MKAILVSFFRSGNIGDVLISNMLYEQYSKYTNIEVFDYSGKKADYNAKCKVMDFSKKAWLYNKLKVIRKISHKKASKNIQCTELTAFEAAISNAELLIIGGGNMIMDLEERSQSWLQFQRFIVLALKQKKKIFVCNIGIGPFYSEEQEENAAKILHKCDYITFRDEASQKYYRKWFSESDKAFLSIDPVFLLEKRITKQKSRKEVIGINVIDPHLFGNPALYQNVLAGYIKLIETIRTYSQNEIMLYSTEINDGNILKEVYKRTKQLRHVRKVQIKTKSKLLQLYSRTGVVIGARMHALITAYTQEVPVIGLEWQQKVSSFFNIISCRDNLYSLDELDKKSVVITKKALQLVAQEAKLSSFDTKDLFEVNAEILKRIVDKEGEK